MSIEAAGRRLPESVADSRGLLQSSRDVFYRVDLATGRYDYISPSAEAVVGYTPSELMALDAESALAMVHPTDLPALRAAVERLAATGAEVAEYRSRTKAGAYRWLSDQMSLIRDDSGRPLFRVGWIRDLSEHKRALEALAESEQRYREIVETAQEGIATHDAEGTLTYVNQRMADMLGYPREELIGRSSLEFLDEVDREAVIRARQKLRDEGSFSTERRLRRKDGSILWTLSNISPRRDPLGCFVGYLAMHTDITSRKLAETALREREEDLRKRADDLNRAQAMAHLGSWRWELKNDRVSWSEELYRIFGVDPRTFVPSNAAVAQMIHPADRARHAEMVTTALAGHSVPAFDSRIIRPGGDERVVQASGFDVEADELGEPLCLFGTVLDITERKRTEEALHVASVSAENERRRLAAVLEALPVGVAIIDMAGGNTLSNKAFDELWGHPPAAAQSVADYVNYKAWWAVTGRPLLPEEWASAQVLKTGKSVVDQFVEIERFDGSRAFVLNSAAPVHDANGDFVGAVVALQDVTPLHAAQEAVRRHEARLTQNVAALTRMHALSSRNLGVEGLPALLQEVMDAAVAILAAERGTLQLLEGDCLQIVAHHGHTQPFLDFFAQAENQASACGTALERKERVVVPDVEASDVFVGTPSLAVLREAHVRAVQSTPMISRDGMLLGILTTHWGVPHLPDESDLWRIDLLARQAADLIQTVRATTSLREANEQMAVLNRRKDEFISILSHELRNPIAPIRYAVPILQQERLSERGERALAVIQRQLDHLARLLDDLLEVSRITSGKISLQRAQVTVQRVCNMALERSSPAITAERHSLHLAIPEELIWIHGDAARLSQIVGNLLDNAAKYTPPGGHVTLSVKRERAEAVVSVRDTGVGIAAGSLPDLFTLFHQVQRPERLQAGLGIGLALAKQLVNLHGGKIEVHSAGLGAGAEFVVRLPLSEEQQTVQETPLAAPTSPGRLKVLVVDDNADLVEMLAVVVEGDGHEVRRAFDGPSAISAAIVFRPDVILLDLGLPGMSGIEVARELRRRHETPAVYLVALTGWGQEEDRKATRSAGFNAHLTKPADPETLKRLLSEVSGERR